MPERGRSGIPEERKGMVRTALGGPASCSGFGFLHPDARVRPRVECLEWRAAEWRGGVVRAVFGREERCREGRESEVVRCRNGRSGLLGSRVGHGSGVGLCGDSYFRVPALSAPTRGSDPAAMCAREGSKWATA
jgi:hypothetical protein